MFAPVGDYAVVFLAMASAIALFVEKSKKKNQETKTGQFGADMKVSLVNDGPVTFWLQASPEKPS